MAVMNDRDIREAVEEYGMIEPFVDEQVSNGVVSYGLSSYGYDVRISDRFKFYRGQNSLGIRPANMTLDPKIDASSMFMEVVRDCIDLSPGTFLLAETVEYFRIPRGAVAISFGKSTYARLGVGVNITPFEPEWKGKATIQVYNAGAAPVRIYAREGIAQVMFIIGMAPCEVSYADRKGQYQNQNGIQLPAENRNLEGDYARV